MNTSKFDIDANWEDGKVKIIVNGETVRSVSPIHMQSYKFKVNNEDYYFVYEQLEIRGTKYRSIHLYPINEFKNNKIDL